jgi:hypothetical protein
MQTRWQSFVEVTIDFAFSIAINIGAQLTFYHDLATIGRMTLFASLVLGLAFARRLATRRCFERYVSPGARQSHWHSMLEAISDTLLGLVITVALQRLVYGDAATLLRASSLTLAIYGVTMLRRDLLRRLCVWLSTRATVSARA